MRKSATHCAAICVVFGKIAGQRKGVEQCLEVMNPMIDIAANKALVQRYVDEVQNGHDIDALDTIFAQDFIDHADTFDGLFQGMEGLKRGYVEMLSAFPDYRVTMHEQIGEGDRVVTYKTISFTHQGAFQGIPATGKRIEFKVIDIFRIENNLIAECWLVFEELKFLRQLGAIPLASDR